MKKREKIYTQNLEKRIDFICKFCGIPMKFMRKPNRIIIECQRCNMYFVITGKVFPKCRLDVLWSK